MRYLYTLYALLLFLVCFIILLPLIFIFSCFAKGRTYNWYLLKGWSYVWFFLLGIKVRLHYQQKIEKNKPYIFIANHSSFLDTPFIFRICPIPVIPLATDNFARIPIFGFLYRQMAILVNRKSAESRLKSVLTLKRVLSEKHSVLLFPEGGFNDTERILNRFYNGAFQLAKETQTVIIPVVFPDTAKRWSPLSFWRWQPGLCRAFFLKPIVPAIGNAALLKEQAFEQMKGALETAATQT